MCRLTARLKRLYVDTVVRLDEERLYPTQYHGATTGTSTDANETFDLGFMGKAEQPVVPPWEETLAHWTHRARRVTRAINRDYNVAGLCREFPQRLADVVERQGDRLPK